MYVVIQTLHIFGNRLAEIGVPSSSFFLLEKYLQTFGETFLNDDAEMLVSSYNISTNNNSNRKGSNKNNEYKGGAIEIDNMDGVTPEGQAAFCCLFPMP